MAEKLPGEVISPMIWDGVLYWCKDDTFNLHLKLHLAAMGREHLLSEDDTVEVCFYDKSDFCIHKFSSNAENGNCINLSFDESVTSAFDKGRYTYDICVTAASGKRTTVANNNVAVVL